MNKHVPAIKAVAVARVVHYGGRRRPARGAAAGRREFGLGDAVRSLVQVKNDGICPHRDIGESVVQQGDAGAVREKWSFLGEIYYTVQFAQLATVVIMRGREMSAV
ncbi:MAG: nitrogen fixation protein NifZ [Tardiphaga sp.]|jgi:nitrogen fixation protein NifZ|nr:nitrogen fixation protein NifZ [Tardiphaga sp.]